MKTSLAPFPRLYTPREAELALGVPSKRLAAWERAGRLTAVRTPGGRGHRRYSADQIDRMAGRRSP